MNLKTKIVLGLISLAITFALGRYTKNQDTVIKQETEDEKNKEKDKDKKKVTVIIKKPDGTEITKIIEETKIREKETQRTVDKLYQEVKSRTGLVNVSALIGTEHIRQLTPVYGLSVSKEILGPVTVGAWGMTNSSIGVSLGVNF